jgi:hypothetical protein
MLEMGAHLHFQSLNNSLFHVLQTNHQLIFTCFWGLYTLFKYAKWLLFMRPRGAMKSNLNFDTN